MRLRRARAEREGGAVRDADGSLRLDGVTLVRPDGTATYQLATVADDLELGITHVIRGSDHRPNEVPQQRIARAIGGELPEVIHHGLLLGDDGKKLSKRHGHAAVGDLRDDGIPAAAVRAYLDELGLPAHDVHLDRARIGRLADRDHRGDAGRRARRRRRSAARVSRVLSAARGPWSRHGPSQSRSPSPRRRPSGGSAADPRALRRASRRSPETLAEADARAIVRELKAVGGDLRPSARAHRRAAGRSSGASSRRSRRRRRWRVQRAQTSA